MVTATTLVRRLQPLLSDDVMCSEPTAAPLARAKGKFRFQIMLRAPTTKAITRPLRQVNDSFPWPKEVRHTVDVDALRGARWAKYEALAAKSRELYDKAKDRLAEVDFKQKGDQVLEYIRTNPGKAVLIALAAGFLVGYATRPRD